jgi:hypothetical protein
MRKHLTAILAATSIFLAVPEAGALTLSTGTDTGGSIATFGFPDTLTYGQVFTAPVTGTLDSFALFLDGDVGGDLFGGVGVWNGTEAYSEGGGVSQILYTSPTGPSTSGFSAYNFNPGIEVTAGALYVAFISVFGTNADGTTSMPLASDADQPGINYFVWNNSGSPDSAQWNYFFHAGDALFNASFTPSVTPVPVPAALPLLATGLAGLGFVARRRKSVH